MLFEVEAGDVALFVSDVWHRGMPAGPGGRGRDFLQVHYGRRDIAQRIRTTAEVNHLSPKRSPATTHRERTLLGLHNTVLLRRVAGVRWPRASRRSWL